MTEPQTTNPKPTLLDPPYDGYAVWHQHAFPPDGCSWPESDEDDLNWDCRFDAVEDRLGRIFVWHVGSGRPVAICADRDTAVVCAIALVWEYVHG